MPPRVALVEGWTFTVCEASTLWNLSNCIASQAGAPEKPWSLVRAGLSPHSPWHWCRQPRAWCSESPLPVLCHRSSSLAAEPCSWSLVRHQVPAHRFCPFLQQVAVELVGSCHPQALCESLQPLQLDSASCLAGTHPWACVTSPRLGLASVQAACYSSDRPDLEFVSLLNTCSQPDSSWL